MLELIGLAREGAFPGGNHLGQVGYAPYHEVDAAVPSPVREKMELIRSALLDGSLKTGVPPSKDLAQTTGETRQGKPL